MPAATAGPGDSGLPPGGDPAGRAARSRKSVLALALLLFAVAAGTVLLLAVFAAPYAGAAGGCGGG